MEEQSKYNNIISYKIRVTILNKIIKELVHMNNIVIVLISNATLLELHLNFT